ncbi:hypothetical protein HAX54_033949 [Datura stramonium]|uniref:Uncharacterized protein n=1 Tax=Datura stramonium TaxID=4076 RepID=A0ABS8SDR4_DATST|nr:hypothetical protein [Datura stramonium]
MTIQKLSISRSHKAVNLAYKRSSTLESAFHRYSRAVIGPVRVEATTQNSCFTCDSRVETGETPMWHWIKTFSYSLLPSTGGSAAIHGSPPAFSRSRAGTTST